MPRGRRSPRRSPRRVRRPRRRSGRARPRAPARATPSAAMALVDEDAGDPPARRRRRVLRVFAAVLEIERVRTAVLAPALRDALLVEDQRGVRAARADQLLLERAGIADAALVLDVIAGRTSSLRRSRCCARRARRRRPRSRRRAAGWCTARPRAGSLPWMSVKSGQTLATTMGAAGIEPATPRV